MAYFPNASTAEMAKENNCYLCRNWKIRDESEYESCPIGDIHFIGNYKQYKNKVLKELLEILWLSEDGYPGKCSMFESNGECRGQMTFAENSLKHPIS